MGCSVSRVAKSRAAISPEPKPAGLANTGENDAEAVPTHHPDVQQVPQGAKRTVKDSVAAAAKTSPRSDWNDETQSVVSGRSTRAISALPAVASEKGSQNVPLGSAPNSTPSLSNREGRCGLNTDTAAPAPSHVLTLPGDHDGSGVPVGAMLDVSRIQLPGSTTTGALQVAIPDVLVPPTQPGTPAAMTPLETAVNAATARSASNGVTAAPPKPALLALGSKASYYSLSAVHAQGGGLAGYRTARGTPHPTSSRAAFFAPDSGGVAGARSPALLPSPQSLHGARGGGSFLLGGHAGMTARGGGTASSAGLLLPPSGSGHRGGGGAGGSMPFMGGGGGPSTGMLQRLASHEVLVMDALQSRRVAQELAGQMLQSSSASSVKGAAARPRVRRGEILAEAGTADAVSDLVRAIADAAAAAAAPGSGAPAAASGAPAAASGADWRAFAASLPVVPKSAEERALLADALGRNFLFTGLSTSEKAAIVDAMARHAVPAGAVVIAQGAASERAYVVCAGLLEVVAADGTHVSELPPGTMCGELALLYSGAAAAAEVRAALPCALFSVDRATFRGVVLAAAVKAFEDAARFLRGVALLATLSDAQIGRLAEAAQRVTFAPGARIVQQGDAGNVFYLVMAGTVRVVKEVEAAEAEAAASAAVAALPAAGSADTATVPSRYSVSDAAADAALLPPPRGGSVHHAHHHHHPAASAAAGTAGSDDEDPRDAGDGGSVASFGSLDAPVEGATALALRPGSRGTAPPLAAASAASEEDAVLDEHGMYRNEIELMQLEAGSFFGERALLHDAPRAASVVAVSEATCLALSREQFTTLLGPLQDVLAGQHAQRQVVEQAVMAVRSLRQAAAAAAALQPRPPDEAEPAPAASARALLLDASLARVSSFVSDPSTAAEAATVATAGATVDATQAPPLPAGSAAAVVPPVRSMSTAQLVQNSVVFTERGMAIVAVSDLAAAERQTTVGDRRGSAQPTSAHRATPRPHSPAPEADGTVPGATLEATPEQVETRRRVATPTPSTGGTALRTGPSEPASPGEHRDLGASPAPPPSAGTTLSDLGSTVVLPELPRPRGTAAVDALAGAATMTPRRHGGQPLSAWASPPPTATSNADSHRGSLAGALAMTSPLGVLTSPLGVQETTSTPPPAADSGPPPKQSRTPHPPLPVATATLPGLLSDAVVAAVTTIVATQNQPLEAGSPGPKHTKLVTAAAATATEAPPSAPPSAMPSAPPSAMPPSAVLAAPQEARSLVTGGALVLVPTFRDLQKGRTAISSNSTSRGVSPAANSSASEQADTGPAGGIHTSAALAASATALLLPVPAPAISGHALLQATLTSRSARGSIAERHAAFSAGLPSIAEAAGPRKPPAATAATSAAATAGSLDTTSGGNSTTARANAPAPFDWRANLAAATASSLGTATAAPLAQQANSTAALAHPPTPFTAAAMAASTAANPGTARGSSAASSGATAAASARHASSAGRTASGAGAMPSPATSAAAAGAATSSARNSSASSQIVVTTAASRASLLPPPPRPEVSLADLEFMALLGEGAFGLVRLVRHRATKEVFALKQMQKARIVANNQQRNVMNEKRILSRLAHPNIIAFVSTFKDRDCLFLLCEYCPGGDLFGTLIRAGGVLSSPEAMYYASVVTSVLDYLHCSGVVYRDLKPENLLLDRDGVLKVCDFGFAKNLAQLGRTYTLCGTPEYLAPELVQGRGHGYGVDWWAVGILLFEMLSGYSPFADHEANDQVTIYKNILRGKLRFPSALRDAAAKDLISRLLTANPSQRLGCLRGGGADVKAHPFFARVDWDALLRKAVTPPIRPHLKSQLDTSNFDDVAASTAVQPYTDSSGDAWCADF